MSKTPQGLHIHRLKPHADNPREVAFVEQWAKEHERSDLLCVLFQVPCMRDDPDCIDRSGFCGGGYHKAPIGEPTERDRIVAATLIQWLGSNCGLGMVMEALDKCGYKIVRN